MSKQDYLKGITPELLTTFKNKQAFSMFASSSMNNGVVQIGVDGNGQYNVKARFNSGMTSTYYYTIPSEAIEKYSELIT